MVKHWLRSWGPYIKNHHHLVKKWLESHKFIVEPCQKSCNSLGVMSMVGKVSECWVGKWWTWLENSLEVTKKGQQCWGSVRPRAVCRPRGSSSGAKIPSAWSSTTPFPLGLAIFDTTRWYDSKTTRNKWVWVTHLIFVSFSGWPV